MKNILNSVSSAALLSIGIFSISASAQTIPDRPINSCCDPVLASLDYKTMFSLDLMPGGNLSSQYGLNFTPTSAFNTALDNTAFINAVMAGISTAPGSLNFLVLEGNMRTDNAPNSSWPTTLPALWSSMSISINPTNRILAYNQVFLPTATVVNSPRPFGYTELNVWSASNPPPPRHMRSDGTRYLIKLDYWMYNIDPKTHTVTKRPVNCSNFRSVYIGSNQNPAGLRGTGSSGTKLNLISQTEAAGQASTRAASQNVSQLLTAAEVAALPKEMRETIR